MKPRKTADISLFLTVTGLLLASLAFVYTASASFSVAKTATSEGMLFKHATKVILAIIAMLAFTKIDYHKYQSHTKWLMLLAIAFLGAVLVIGHTELGAKRWLPLGPFSFQPSEFVKIALVLHIASLCAAKKEFIGDFKRSFLPMMIWTGVAAVLIARQPNMSNAAVLMLLTFGIMFVAQMPIKYMMSTGMIAILGGGIYLMTAWYRVQRILAFMGHDNEHTSRIGYQTTQAMIALGNGGLFGVGIGQSRQRDFYLPESYGDFIYSVIGEEYGFIGAAFLLIIFAFIIIRGIQIAKHAPDPFGRYVAFGITIMLGVNALINALVNSGLMPVTGLPMPFVSYGGTSMIFSAAAVGILLNISKYTETLPNPKKIRPSLRFS
ncbi:MAG: putative lipid II flippase FtsW [Bacteroidota bacterium]|nr:putative lipid II flippase FtsW [Bacteroidota bacterium]MDP4228826.1 putative lipid II flippase FtsW [Bacteroidota bacterium]MDP4235142.1 putative lipid II flippase FtsW [Bacteroidota bacterium]